MKKFRPKRMLRKFFKRVAAIRGTWNTKRGTIQSGILLASVVITGILLAGVLLAGILSIGESSVLSYLITTSTSRILENDDIASFRVFYTPSTVAEIRVEGFILHNSRGIYEIEASANGKLMKIVLRSARVTRYNIEKFKGALDYRFAIPKSVDTVTFGRKNVVIWDRKEANNGVRVKKIKGGGDFGPLEEKYKKQSGTKY